MRITRVQAFLWRSQIAFWQRLGFLSGFGRFLLSMQKKKPRGYMAAARRKDVDLPLVFQLML
jgi:hypothetical protein